MTKRPLILLTLPGIRPGDVDTMPHLRAMTAAGELRELVPSFPALTASVQANMTTGTRPDKHGVIGNGFYYSFDTFPERPVKIKRYWGDLPIDESFMLPDWPAETPRNPVDFCSAPADCVGRPQIWDKVRRKIPNLTSALWFTEHIRGATADYLCSPPPAMAGQQGGAMRFYSRPSDAYGQWCEKMGPFPLDRFWGPNFGRESSEWIAASAVLCMATYKPQWMWLSLPHLGFAPQKFGPDSPQAKAAVLELDEIFGMFSQAMSKMLGREPLYLIAGECAVTDVDSVVYPNRILREMKLLSVDRRETGETVNLALSRAFAVCDHQVSHVYFNVADESLVRKVADRFRQIPELHEVLALDERKHRHVLHERSGDIVLVSRPDSWQAYPWWFDDANAPTFARTVDRRKPGFDPCEMFADNTPGSESDRISLDASNVRGSFGAPVLDASQRTVLLSSSPELVLPKSRGKKKPPLSDVDVSRICINYFLCGG